MKRRKQITPDLAQLFAIFAEEPADSLDYEIVTADQVPQPYHQLLVHEHHMTVTVEAHHGEPVKLRILDQCRQGNLYARKIMLLLQSNGRPVQFGIMRFNFEYCSAAVRDEILRGQTPLGRILIEHNVLRRIELVAVLKVLPTSKLIDCFAVTKPIATYGRLAIIYCDDQPAVELLEIVAPETTP